MIPRIPPEIWLQVAQFLPDNCLQKLFTVNNAFLQAAMDARYRTVTLFKLVLDGPGMDKTLQRLSRLRCDNRVFHFFERIFFTPALSLRQSHVGRRVRRVIVELSYIDHYFTHYDKRVLRDAYDPLTTPKRSSRVSPSLNTHCDPLQQLSLALTNTFASFTHIAECDLRWEVTSHRNTVLLMAYLWPSFGAKVRILRWESPSRSLQSFLPATTSTIIHSLEQVYFQMHPLSEVNGEESCKAIASFLSLHRSTVRSLSFLSISRILYKNVMDVSCLFDMLGYFPQLRHLCLDLGIVLDTYIQMSTPTAIARFLNDHAKTLQSLTVKVSGISRVFRHMFRLLEIEQGFHIPFDVSLPSLLTLSISHECIPGSDMPVMKSAVLALIPQFSDTVSTLLYNAFTDNIALTYEEVNTVVSAFSHRSPETGLKVLLLAVDILSPELVDLLANTLPGLVKLTLKVRNVQSHSQQFKVTPDIFRMLDGFRAEMKTRLYDEWALRRLTVVSLSDFDQSSIAEIITQSIPNIQKWT